jgi:hypothetical protein
MNEEQTFSLEINGQFFADDEPVRVHGTAGEVLEQIADHMGLEDEEMEADSFGLNGCDLYPSSRAMRAHTILEERLGKSGAYDNPESLIDAVMREGFARRLSEAEYEEWIEEQGMDEYDEARSELDDEWKDGVWET